MPHKHLRTLYLRSASEPELLDVTSFDLRAASAMFGACNQMKNGQGLHSESGELTWLTLTTCSKVGANIKLS